MDTLQQVKVVFGILSANNPADIVQQIIDSLGNDCYVIVHHDYGQRPDFVLTGENVYVIENPVRTGWGVWSQVEAILSLLQHAKTHCEFDYFQLLSDSCLPIRPLSEFKQKLATQRPDIMMDFVDIKTNQAVFLSHSYRCYIPFKTFLNRIYGRARLWALGPGPYTVEKIAGLGIPLTQRGVTRLARIKQMIGRSFVSTLRLRDFITHRPRVYVGSTWFCVSRQACEFILSKASDSNYTAHFARLNGPDEIFFPTIIGNSHFRKLVPANHATIWRQRGSGPEEIQEADLPSIMNSDRFFARKFSKQSDQPVRNAVLARNRKASEK